MDFTLVTAPRKLKPSIKAKLRAKIPKLNEKQLKRLQMPFHEALTDELQEYNLIKALEVYRKILDTDSKQGRNLEKNKTLLSKIFHSLKEIDNKSNETEITTILNIIADIMDFNEQFDWLIELLFIHSWELIEKFNLNGSKIDVIVKFTHASSLIQRLQWYRPAVILLESAFQLASLNEGWSFKSDILCVVISHQLSDCLTKLSRQVREDEKDIEGALVLSKRSLKVIRKYISNECKNYEIEAEFEYATCHFENQSFENALNHYNHALTIAESEQQKIRCCEILVKIARCHERLNDSRKFENYLLIAKDLAQELKDFDFQGEIYLKLAEYFRLADNFEKASIYLNTAVQCFHKSKNAFKLNYTKSLFANIKAKTNFNFLIDTILRCDKSKMGKNRDYNKLVLWFDRKYPLTNWHHEFYRIDDEDHDLNVFIKKYYDPDEIIKIQ